MWRRGVEERWEEILVEMDLAVDRVRDTYNPCRWGLGDTNPPQLTAFSIDSTKVDTRISDQTVTVTCRLTDNLSGFEQFSFDPTVGEWTPPTVNASALFRSPSNTQTLGANGSVDIDATGASFTGGVSVPQSSEAGFWMISSFTVSDGSHNRLSGPLRKFGNVFFLKQRELRWVGRDWGVFRANH